ncbi:MAG: hypothetical protein V1767_03815 [Chloroflexota bacterium]
MSYPRYFKLAIATAKGLLVQQPTTEFVILPRIIETYGYLPIGFCLLGTFLLAIKGDKKSYGLVLGLIALLLMLVTFYSLHHGVAIMYERGLMYTVLMIGIVAGAGLAGIKNLRLFTSTTEPRANLTTQIIGGFLCLAAVTGTLVVTIPDRLNIAYYHMIDEQDYRAFTWIRDYVSQSYKKAILDPWKGTAFAAITNKAIYSRTHMAPLEKDRTAYDFLKAGSKDTAFLKSNGISIVYTRVYDSGQDRNIEYSSSNPNLTEAAKDTYLIK